MEPVTNRVRSEFVSVVLPLRLTTLLLRSRSYQAWKVLYWVVGICKTITNSASANAEVEARLSLAIQFSFKCSEL